MLHKLLRGRYRYAIPLTALGLIGGAVAGYFTWHPVYESVTLVQVDPVIRGLAVDDERIMPAYEGFIGSQVETIRSERIIQMALNSPTWQAFARQNEAVPGVETFSANLSVTHPGNSQIIRIAYEGPEPQLARTAVTVVNEAFFKVFAENNVESDGVRLQMLNNRRDTMRTELNVTRDRIRNAAGELGEDGLRTRYQLYLDEFARLERILNETKLQMAALQSQDETRDPDVDPEAEDDAWTREQLTRRDPLLQEYRGRLRSIENEMSLLEGMGLGREHRQLDVLEQRRQQTMADVDRRLAEIDEQLTRGLPPDLAVGDGAGVVRDAAQLRRVADYVATQREDVQRNVLDLAARLDDIQRLRDEATGLQSDLDATIQNIEQFNIQASISGKINTISEASTPRTPVNAGKRLQYVVGGAGGGAGLVLGLLVLAGLADRRVRYSEDIASNLGPLRMLGMLPHLSDAATEAAESRQMVWGVQHVRTVLQLDLDRNEQNLVVVTSAVSGSGKTSLTLALGTSFASTGRRVLLIDFDLVGKGLSRQLASVAQQRLGKFVVEAGALAPEDLDRALAHGRSNEQRLGDALLQMGLIERDELEDALARQRASQRGLTDVLSGRPLTECVTETDVSNLWVLASGSNDEDFSGRVNNQAIRELFAQARAAYDVVLVDTGPVPGTVETSVLATQADQVLLTVSRGEQHADYERAVGHLVSIDARIGGVVFNRAVAQDMKTSAYSTTSQTSSAA